MQAAPPSAPRACRRHTCGDPPAFFREPAALRLPAPQRADRDSEAFRRFANVDEPIHPAYFYICLGRFIIAVASPSNRAPRARSGSSSSPAGSSSAGPFCCAPTEIERLDCPANRVGFIDHVPTRGESGRETQIIILDFPPEIVFFYRNRIPSRRQAARESYVLMTSCVSYVRPFALGTVFPSLPRSLQCQKPFPRRSE